MEEGDSVGEGGKVGDVGVLEREGGNRGGCRDGGRLKRGSKGGYVEGGEGGHDAGSCVVHS